MLNRIIFLVLVLICFSVPNLDQARAQEVPQSVDEIKLSFAPLVKKVAPAVVNIYTRTNLAKRYKAPFLNDPFFSQLFNHEFFGGMREQLESALGSGVIVSEDGLIVTNAHVIEHADSVKVALANGSEYDARVILSDRASDLALLRINEDGLSLPYVRLKPSETLEVGDLVLAIGNPFGVGQTVTSGIVSAQGRSTLDINDYNFFIQTDAAINPGNSGGPLVAMDGGVVGINTAIYSRSGGSLGIGFAIPSEMVASVIAAGLSGQSGDRGIIRPWFGVEAQNLTPELAANLNANVNGGALITQLHSASPLREAGAQQGDIITAINGRAVQSAPEMKFRIATVMIGQNADVQIIRSGKQITLTLKAIAPPDIPPRNQIVLQGRHILNGFVVANLNPAVAVELGLKGEEQGVVVMSVPATVSFFRILQPGDIILEINGRVIKQPADMQAAMNNRGAQGYKMTVKRGGRITQIFLN